MNHGVEAVSIEPLQRVEALVGPVIFLNTCQDDLPLHCNPGHLVAPLPGGPGQLGDDAGHRAAKYYSGRRRPPIC